MIHLDAGGVALLALASLAAAAVNAVAGGGSLLSFPALLLLGYPALVANVSNTVGLLGGYAGGSLAYRDELRLQGGRVRFLGALGAVGAVLGALLLTRTAAAVFQAVVPWLILGACGLLLVQPLVVRRVASTRAAEEEHRAPALAAATIVSGVYGAFFGAGLGVLLLGVIGLFIHDSLQRLNALKGVLSLVINVVAAAYFVVFGPVAWQVVAVMLPASLAGGFIGVALARRLPSTALRTVVVLYGIAVSVRLLV